MKYRSRLFWCLILILAELIKSYFTGGLGLAFSRSKSLRHHCHRHGAVSTREHGVNEIVGKFRAAAALTGALFVGSSASRVGAKEASVGASNLVGTRGFQTKSGLKYFDIKEGTGLSPIYGQMISFRYTMYYRASPDVAPEIIDESKQPFLHKHGNGRIVRGLDEAIHTMKVGGSRRAVIPKSLGKLVSEQ